VLTRTPSVRTWSRVELRVNESPVRVDFQTAV
jgi:hypothetical protein